jgi:hypothetical protein
LKGPVPGTVVVVVVDVPRVVVLVGSVVVVVEGTVTGDP